MEQGEAYLWKQRAQTAADKIKYLERLLSRAYPWLHNPYTPQTNAQYCVFFDTMIHEIQQAIQHVPDEVPDPEDDLVNLPCASCDGDGCPNCEAPMVLSE